MERYKRSLGEGARLPLAPRSDVTAGITAEALKKQT